MTEQTIPIHVVEGDVEVTPIASDKIPTAVTAGPSIGEAQFRLTRGSRLAMEANGPRSLNPYWEITEYTTEEIAAVRETDELPPILAERYRDLLDD